MDLSVQNDDKAVLCGFDCFVEEKGALIGSLSKQKNYDWTKMFFMKINKTELNVSVRRLHKQ